MYIKRMKTVKKGIATLKAIIGDYEADWLRNTKECEHLKESNDLDEFERGCNHLGRDYDPVCDHMDCPLLRE
jgi:hypothetical protein